MKATTESRAAPNRRGSLLQRHSQELRLLAEYYLWAALQWPFTFVFWAIEQRRGRIRRQACK